MDLAASVQKVMRISYLNLLVNVTYVALNCVAKFCFSTIFGFNQRLGMLVVQGAALSKYTTTKNVLLQPSVMRFLGPEFTDKEIETELKACGANFTSFLKAEMIEEVASALADEKRCKGGWSLNCKIKLCKNNLTLKLNKSF